MTDLTSSFPPVSGMRQGGLTRRRIEISARGEAATGGEVRTALEDDFHHFRVTIRHAAGKVTAIDAEPLRVPWSACPAAVDRLPEFLGAALSDVAEAAAVTDPRLQCTHMFDLACLAIAAATRPPGRRRYDIEVTDRALGGRTIAAIARDGQPLFAWDIDDSTVVAPARFAGLSLKRDFAPWVKRHLDLAEAEAAIALRRTAFIAAGRSFDLDKTERMLRSGGCITQTPERAAGAVRMKGTTFDFTSHPDVLAKDDQAWLAFSEL